MKKKITLLMASLCLCVGTTKAATWVSPLVSSDTETYLYYIKNSRNADYYVTTTSGLNGGAQQLGSANSFNDSKAKVVFKLMANGKLYATNVGETPLVVGYTTTDGAANSVQLFTADNSYTWRIALEGSENAVAGFSLNAGSSTNSWNMHGGAGANIGLYGNTDGGSTWVFEPANEAATANSNSISAQNKLSNTSIYTITTAGRGAWLYSSEKNALTSTWKANVAKNVNDVNQQFAFLTMNGETYLYSVGAQKFVIKSGGYTTLSDNPSQGIQFVASTGSLSPIVLAFNGSHAGVSNGYNPAVITSYNSTNDAGNQSIILPTGLTGDFSTALAAIETAQLPMAQADLQNSIDAANAWAAVAFLSEAKEADLTAAIQTATEAKNATDATYTGLKAAKTTLDNFVATIPGGEVGGFSNNTVYTFISKRNENSYLMYDGEHDFVASPYKQTSLEVGSDKLNCQWAVYKSESGKYYMYNLGAQKFMGTETAANTGIPFSTTPQTTELKLKITSVATHPIMISSNGGEGTVNHSAEASFTNNYGVVNWDNDFGHMADNGNVHKVAVVGTLEESVLTTIAGLVEAYESRGVAVQELNERLEAFKTSYFDAWAGTAYKWRDQKGVNNYTIGYDSALTLEEYYNNAKAVAEDENATAEDLNEQIEILEDVETRLTINQPEEGKFYRLRCVGGDQLYLSADISNSRFEMQGQDKNTPDHIFMYNGGALLSYSKGLYMSHHDFNGIGATSTVTFTEAANGAKGQYNIKVGERYIYGKGDTQNNHVDSGTGNPTATSTNGYNWWLEEVTELPVVVTDAGYATLFAPVALSIPEGVTAYTGTVNGAWLTLNEVMGGVIPANTGVVLKAEANTYNFVVADNVEGIDGNDLAGTAAKASCTAEANYTLANGEDGVGFYLYQGTTLAGFRAYLPKGDAAAPALRIRLAGEETGIEQIAGDAELVIYDLAGRRVEKMEKGIYIVNGKKVVIK